MYDSIVKTRGDNMSAQQSRRGIRVCLENPKQDSLVHSTFHLQLHDRHPGEQAAFFSKPNDDKPSCQLSSTAPHLLTASDRDRATLASSHNPLASSCFVQQVQKNDDLAEVMTKLFHLLERRDPYDGAKAIDEVKTLLGSIPASDLNTLRDKDGKTALEIAVRRTDPLAIKLLIEHGVDPRNHRPGFFTALHVAADKGDVALTEILINHGVDLNVSPDGNDTPLIRAAWRGHLAVVKLLVKNGARLDLRRVDNATVLTEAMQSGNLKLIEFLLSANKNTTHAFAINQQDIRGNTALSKAYAKHACWRQNAWEDEKDLQDMIFLLQNQGASKDFSMSRHSSDFTYPHRAECIERAVRDGLGKQEDRNAKIAFVDAVEAYYHPNDKSYRSLLKNIPVSTRYEEEQKALRAYLLKNQ